MRKPTRLSFFLQTGAFAAAFLLLGSAARAQLSGATDINLSQKTGDDSECAIAKNPANKNQLFALCNTGSPGLFAARSTDGGVTWVFPDPADKTIADGDAGQGPAACCDPTLAWDTFGNLYITYISSSLNAIVTILSTDGGSTFSNLASFTGSVDQPTVVSANTSAPGAPVAVWIVWNQSGQMVARGAAVTGLGAIGAFGALQTIPGTANCSFGDIAIAPTGAVVQACESPTGGQGPATIFVNTDADGFGLGNFGAAVAATTTNVGGFDFIPAQNARSVDAEAGLAFDNNPASPHFGRLYLVYTEETVNENNDLDIMLRFSDNNGGTWSPPIRVNDDPAAPVRSQFLPKIAIDDTSGNISVCWHDCRNSATNTAMQEFCTAAPPTGASPTFLPNAQISDGLSISNGAGIEFGDYSGLDYSYGVAHPIWADTSNSTGNNPNGTANFDALTDRVTAKEGEQAPVLQYAVKFVCGRSAGRVVARGTYFTAINLHNPTEKAIRFKTKFAVARPMQAGVITPFFDFRLKGDQAMEIDCPNIRERVQSDHTPLPLLTFLKGFAVIQSDTELDVVAVYTAAGSTGRVETLDIETASPRRIEPCAGPDLIVESILKPTWDDANHRSVITASIKNVGTAPAGPSVARVVDPTTLQPSGAPYNAIAATPALAPGASATVVFYLPYWVYNPDVTLEVTADYKNDVEECNEGNNVKVFEDAG